MLKDIIEIGKRETKKLKRLRELPRCSWEKSDYLADAAAQARTEVFTDAGFFDDDETPEKHGAFIIAGLLNDALYATDALKFSPGMDEFKRLYYFGTIEAALEGLCAIFDFEKNMTARRKYLDKKYGLDILRTRE